MPTTCALITQNVSPVLCPCPTTMYPERFMTDTITAKLATAATSAVITPGRRRISRSGAAVVVAVSPSAP